MLGATTLIGVDSVPARMRVAREMGASHVVDFKQGNVVERIMALTDGRGVDVAIEAWAPRPRSNRRCACCAPGVRCPAWAYTAPTCEFPPLVGTHGRLASEFPNPV